MKYPPRNILTTIRRVSYASCIRSKDRCSGEASFTMDVYADVSKTIQEDTRNRMDAI